jgi:hypothetical protein
MVAARVSIPRVNVGQVLQNAAIFNFSRHRSREGFMNAANIPAEVEAFFDLLDKRAVAYLLVGGVAMLTHVRGRNTDDIDLVISLADQRRLEPELEVLERDSFFAKARFGGLRVDFLATENPLFAQVAREYSDDRVFDFFAATRTIRCATPEGLMVLKLYALPSLYRQGQIDRAKIYEGDIGSLLAAVPQMETEKLLGVLADNGVLPSDVDELRKIIAEQRKPVPRFRTQS